MWRLLLLTFYLTIVIWTLLRIHPALCWWRSAVRQIYMNTESRYFKYLLITCSPWVTFLLQDFLLMEYFQSVVFILPLKSWVLSPLCFWDTNEAFWFLQFPFWLWAEAVSENETQRGERDRQHGSICESHRLSFSSRWSSDCSLVTMTLTLQLHFDIIYPEEEKQTQLFNI